MRICLVSQEYPPDTALGGIGTQTYIKARALHALGHDVHVLSCSAAPVGEVQTRDHDGVTVHRLPPPGEERGREFEVHEPALYAVGYTWSVARHLHRLERDACFDVIDFAEYGAEGFGYQLNRRPWSWTPVVVQLHGPLAMFTERIGWPEESTEFSRVVSFLEGTSIRLADALMACSANIADFAADFYDVDRDGIDVVHCGVDSTQFRASTPASDSDPPYVLFVGNLTTSKGLRTVFDAVMALRSRYRSLRLQVAGRGDDRLVGEMIAQARRAGAEGLVEFRGFLDRREVAELYRDAAVFCSPAQHEVGVANVYLEAMASGCPVVAADTGAAPEAIVHGESGFLVPPNEVAATAAALDRLLCDPALRSRIGEAGRRRVEEYFALEPYIGRVLAVYERAIGVRERASEPGVVSARH